MGAAGRHPLLPPRHHRPRWHHGLLQRARRQLHRPAALTIEAYPNPCTGSFTLALSAPAGSRAALRDNLRRTLWQAGLSQQQLAVTLPANLPTGVYFLSTTANRHTSTQRLSVAGRQEPKQPT